MASVSSMAGWDIAYRSSSNHPKQFPLGFCRISPSTLQRHFVTRIASVDIYLGGELLPWYSRPQYNDFLKSAREKAAPKPRWRWLSHSGSARLDLTR